MSDKATSTDKGAAAWPAFSAASRETADAFLKQQTILAQLQTEDLRRQWRVPQIRIQTAHGLNFTMISAGAAVEVEVLTLGAHDDPIEDVIEKAKSLKNG